MVTLYLSPWNISVSSRKVGVHKAEGSKEADE